MVDQQQERRDETVSIAVTRAEKRDVRFVADAKGVDVANLLRLHSLNEVLAMAPLLRDKLADVA